MTSVIKDKIIRSDLVHWDGLSSTYTKKDSTGGTITGLKLGVEVDVLQVYGGGTNYTKSTIQKAVDAIGSNGVTLVFQPGTWTIDADLTIGSNFVSRVPAGCTFSVSSGKTLTFSGPVIHDAQTWYSGTVTLNGTRYFTGKLDLSGAVLQGGTPLVFEGGTDNAFEVSLVLTDPTADRTITIPDANVDLTSVLTATGSYTISGVHTHSAAIWEAEGTAITSAASIDIWGTTGNTKHITGSTGPITSFGTAPQAGAWMRLICDSTPTFTHGANLNLPDATNYTAYAGQNFLVYADTTTQFDVFPIYPRVYGAGTDKGSGTLNANSGLYDAGQRVGEVLLNSGTVTNAATLDIVMTSYTAYRNKILLLDLIPATDAVALWLRLSTDGGSTYDAGASNYDYMFKQGDGAVGDQATGFAGATAIVLTDATIGNGAAEGINGRISLWNTISTASRPRVTWELAYTGSNATPQIAWAAGTGGRVVAQDTDSIRVQFHTGNIASGNWALYGYN